MTSPFRPRDSVRDAIPYEPGKPVDELMREYDVDRPPLKMGSNENPYPPPEILEETYRSAFTDLNRYPDGGSFQLREALADHHDWSLEGVMAAGGSDEVLDCLGKALLDRGDQVIVGNPAFVRTPMIAGFMGADVVRVPLTEELEFNLSAFLEEVNSDTRMVYLPNPNNPTGRIITREELDWFYDRLPEQVLLVIDEAYFELIQDEDYPDGRRYLRRDSGPGVVVLRTFSKSYGLAGLRVGYGLMEPPLREELDKVRPPFNVTRPAQAVAPEALHQADDYLEQARSTLPDEASRLRQQLEKRGIETVPSRTHFFLCEPPVTPAREAFEQLLEVGVITRPMDGYGLPNKLRISVLEPDDNDEFLHRWDEVF